MALALGSSASSLRVGSGTPSRMYRGSTAFWDADAAAYIRAVEAADGQALELGVCNAYHNFFLELKATPGLFDAIKASCILCGARSLAGALVPVVGDAPTNNNFISDDYNRETGLAGDGSTKFLNANRLLSADPQDDYHCSVYEYTAASSPNSMTLLGGGGAGNGAVTLGRTTSAAYTRCRSATLKTGANVGDVAGFIGISRATGSGYSQRSGGVNTLQTDASSVVGDYITTVFARATTGGGRDSLSDARIAFYSIGESLDLEALDLAVSTLLTAIGVAI
jgi:hypothetical protein